MSPTAKQCIEFACEAYGVSTEDMIDGGRTMEFVWPRWVAMRLCRLYIGMTLIKIGREFGDKSHTTIVHALRKLDQAIETDKHIAKDVAMIESAFQKETGMMPIAMNKFNGYRTSKYSVEEK